uniref:Uncharacterized protein n=1 Tax=uncultured marine virus TaxID=186617 RepID=A0A0F7L845_9VIRU|nr:hypothetical protein [uncultured marine virus]
MQSLCEGPFAAVLGVGPQIVEDAGVAFPALVFQLVPLAVCALVDEADCAVGEVDVVGGHFRYLLGGGWLLFPSSAFFIGHTRLERKRNTKEKQKNYQSAAASSVHHSTNLARHCLTASALTP